MIERLRVRSSPTMSRIEERFFLEYLSNILITFLIYQHSLSVIQGTKEGDYQQHDKLVVEIAFSMFVFFIELIYALFSNLRAID